MKKRIFINFSDVLMKNCDFVQQNGVLILAKRPQGLLKKIINPFRCDMDIGQTQIDNLIKMTKISIFFPFLSNFVWIFFLDMF